MVPAAGQGWELAAKGRDLGGWRVLTAVVCVKERLLLCLVRGELQRLAFGFLSSQRYSYETGVTCSLLSSSPLPDLNMKSAWKARCAAPTPPRDSISRLTSGHKAQLLSRSCSCCLPHVGTLTGEIPAPAASSFTPAGAAVGPGKHKWERREYGATWSRCMGKAPGSPESLCSPLSSLPANRLLHGGVFQSKHPC